MRIRLGAFEAVNGSPVDLRVDGVRVALNEVSDRALSLLLRTPGELVPYGAFRELWPDATESQLKRLAQQRISVLQSECKPFGRLPIRPIRHRGYSVDVGSSEPQTSTKDAFPFSDRSLAALKQDTWLQLFKSLRHSGRRSGWTHHLDEDDLTPVGSAFGLRLGRLLTTMNPERLRLFSDVVDSVIAMRKPNFLWTTHQGGAPLESTAWVILGLAGWVPRGELTKSVDRMASDAITDDLVRSRVTSQTVLIDCLVAVAPDHVGLGDLVQLISPTTEDKVWNRNGICDPAVGTVAHTARACLTLLALDRSTAGTLGAGKERLGFAKSWLLSTAVSRTTNEELVRGRGERRRCVTVSHFDQAMGLRALLELGVPPLQPEMVKLVAAVLSLEKEGLWSLDGDRKPVWATWDAIAALQSWWDAVALSAVS